MNKCSVCLSWVTSSVQRNTRSRHENRAFMLKWFSLRCFRPLDQQENYIHLSIYHHITELIYLNCPDINMIIHEMTPNNSISELNTRNSLICASSWIILLYNLHRAGNSIHMVYISMIYMIYEPNKDHRHWFKNIFIECTVYSFG